MSPVDKLTIDATKQQTVHNIGLSRCHFDNQHLVFETYLEKEVEINEET